MSALRISVSAVSPSLGYSAMPMLPSAWSWWLGDRERLGELREDAAGHARGLAGVGDVREADDELVAAEARRGVLVPQAVREPLGNRRQQQVADRVAERVVDVLEAVEIEEQHGDLAVAAGARGRSPARRDRRTSVRLGSPVSAS